MAERGEGLRTRLSVPRWCRSAAYLCLGLSLLLGWGVGGICYRIHLENGRESITGLPYHTRPGAATRLLVLAPHPDDETLGCGGLLYEAARAGSAVRVVFITNGDGFSLAVRRAYQRVQIGPPDYVRLGERRQREALAALTHLGIPASDAIFLSYPDRGVAHMWLEHWDARQPFRSFYTHASASPYPNTYHPRAPYAGEALLGDLERIVGEFQPTAVYVPHPNDEHPDHWATSCFARAALERLGLSDRVALFTYLVHRGDWPVPQGLHPTHGLAPPAALAHLDTAWQALALRAPDADAKKAALAEHTSQVSVMRRFLTSFLRRTELFGVVPISPVRRAPTGGVRVDGDNSEWGAIEWSAVQPAVEEPTEDSLPVEVQGGGDLAAIRVCRDDRYLYVLLCSRKPVSNQFTYMLYLRALDGKQTEFSIPMRPGKRPPLSGAKLAARGQFIETGIPLSRLGDVHTLFIAATVRRQRFAIDTTGWRVLRIP